MSRKQNFKVYWLILQPHANVLHSYIKDTLTDFINEISETENIADTIHVTLDVTSLCTNILNPEGIESTKEALNCVNQKPIERKIIIRFLLLILTLNNFIFNGFYYLSNMGCAMSTICVPGYSTVFMVKFEKTFMNPCIQSYVKFYCRFIGDLFLSWNRSKRENIWNLFLSWIPVIKVSNSIANILEKAYAF